MAELEQLRKELNELRERVALLERDYKLRPIPVVPIPAQPVLTPPYVVTCGGTP